MASAKFTLPAHGARLKNTVRVELTAEANGVQKERFCRYFVESILVVKKFGVKPGQLLCVQTFEGSGSVDVTTYDVSVCEGMCWKWEELGDHELLRGLCMRKLYSWESIPLFVHMYNPHVEDGDVDTFVSRYCTVEKKGERLKDELGVWNGRRRFVVRLWADPERPGEVKHPPANFTIGPDRGYLRYATQPKICGKCGVEGHLAAKCLAQFVVCRSCNQRGHMAKDCKERACSLCGSKAHLCRACPLKVNSYAGRTGGGGWRKERDIVAGLLEQFADDAELESMLMEAALGLSDQEMSKAMEDNGIEDELARVLTKRRAHGGEGLPLGAEGGVTGSEGVPLVPESPLSPPGAGESQVLFPSEVSETPEGLRPEMGEPSSWAREMEADEEQRTDPARVWAERQVEEFKASGHGGVAGEAGPGAGSAEEEMPQSNRSNKRPAEDRPGQPKHPRAGVDGSRPNGSESGSGGGVPPEETAKELIDKTHVDLDGLDPEAPGETRKVADSPEAEVTGQEPGSPGGPADPQRKRLPAGGHSRMTKRNVGKQ